MDDAVFRIEFYKVELGAAIIYTIIYFLCKVLSPLFIKTYSSFDRVKKVEWDSRIVSNVNAIFVTLGSFYTLFLYPNAWASNPYGPSNPYSTFFISAILGYFCYDLVIVIRYCHLWGYSTIIHHVIGLFTFGAGKFSGTYHYVLCWWIFTEATTPFINQRWFLEAVNKKSSTIYVLNGVVMALGFLFIRALIVPYYTLTAVFQYELASQQNIPTIVLNIGIIGESAICLLNAYWTYLIWKGLIKAVKSMLQTKPTKQA